MIQRSVCYSGQCCSSRCVTVISARSCAFCVPYFVFQWLVSVTMVRECYSGQCVAAVSVTVVGVLLR